MPKFNECGIKMKSMKTGRHAGMNSYMSKQIRKIEHSFDVWHVAKGIDSNYIPICLGEKRIESLRKIYTM